MYPEFAWEFLGNEISIKAYALFTVVGALGGVLVALPILRRQGVPFRQSLGLFILMAPVFLIGARLLNYLVNPKAYGNNLKIYSFRLAGFSFYGGLLGALLAFLFWQRRTKKPLWSLLDALVLPGVVAFSLARLGCFFNGCCGGKPTQSLLGMDFPIRGGNEKLLSLFLGSLGQSTTHIKVYPTQLFELGLALVFLLPIYYLYLKRKLPKGGAFLIYAAAFSAMRLMVLPLRNLPYPDLVKVFFYPLLYLSIIVLSILQCKKLQGAEKKASIKR